jgi:hypothetical protein
MATSGLPAASTPGIGLVKFGLFAEDSLSFISAMKLSDWARQQGISYITASAWYRARQALEAMGCG